MVASASIKDNTIEIIRDIENIKKKAPQKIRQALSFVSALQIRRIKTRTRAGISSTGTKFAPYSKGYGSKKESGFVDLTDSGQMLGSMTFKASQSKGELFFRGREQVEKASIHDLFGAGKKKVIRPFFRINQKDEEVILKTFANIVGGIVNV
tara:strand:+ start:38 stop:493 length:456 start_codon:yes stop_codon:yes gene_type:complete